MLKKLYFITTCKACVSKLVLIKIQPQNHINLKVKKKKLFITIKKKEDKKKRIVIDNCSSPNPQYSNHEKEFLFFFS